MKKSSLSQVNSKSELKKLQINFAQIIRRPLTKDDKMLPDNRAKSIAKASKKLSEHQRMQIYAQQYWWRIKQSFDDDFETVAKLVTFDKYQAIRDLYLVKYPSISFTLRDLGSRFPKFIKTTKSKFVVNTNRKKLAEAASYDWERIECYDTASLPALTDEAIADIKFFTKKLTIQPYIRLLELDYPVHKVLMNRHSIQNEATSNVLLKSKIKKNSSKDKIYNLTKSKTYLALHRLDKKVYVKELKKFEFEILKLFKLGISINSLEKKLKLNRNQEKGLIEIFKSLRSLKWLVESHAPARVSREP